MDMQALGDYLREHSAMLTLLANLGMLFVWVAYLQLFLSSYMRQRRATVLISRGAGTGIDARCVIGNMSADPVDVQVIFAIGRTGRSRVIAEVGDRAEGEGETNAAISQISKHGPIRPGEQTEIGRYSRMLERLEAKREGREAGGKRPPFTSIEVLVFAIHGSDELPVAARRRYRIVDEGGGPVLRPDRMLARQIRGRWQRRLLLRQWRRHIAA